MPIEMVRATFLNRSKDAIQYLGYPLIKLAALRVFKDERKANIVAGTATTALYTGTNALFFGVEANAFDKQMRPAVAAELGIDPEKLQFSDYYQSQNPIVKKRLEVFDLEAKYWYPISALPLLPAAMDMAGVGAKARYERDTRRARLAPNASSWDHMANGWGLYDNLVYAGVAAAWAGETFLVPKTAVYSGQKMVENKKETNRQYDANDLIEVLNRTYTDRGLPPLDGKAERNAIWPVLQKLAEKMNESEAPGKPRFDIPEMMYLIGLDKINIFAKDKNGGEIEGDDGQRVVDPAALKRAFDEIEFVAENGLKKIGKMNARGENNEPAGKMLAPSFNAGAKVQVGAAGKELGHSPGWAERVGRKLLEFEFNSHRALFGKGGKDPEYISSSRDPAEIGMR